jgi:hypothetical protein
MAVGGTTGISRGGIIAAIVDMIRSSPTIIGMTVIVTTGTTTGAGNSIVITATGITIGMATSLAARVGQAVVGPAMGDQAADVLAMATADRVVLADLAMVSQVMAVLETAVQAIVETAFPTSRSSPTLFNWPERGR